MKFVNWLLYEVHRWLGVGLALFMFVWFFSGLVIMYTTPATQSRSQQLAHAETLSPELGWLSVGDAWALSADQRKATDEKRKARAPEGIAGGGRETGEGGARAAAANAVVTIADARLLRSAGEPVWVVEDSRGQRFSISAIDGNLRETTPDQALKIAEAWISVDSPNEATKVSYVETLQNTIMLRNQNALSPFHKIAFGEDGGELLISSRTGEVLHASTTVDRAFYYVGNWIHLFKPLEAIGLGEIRRDVQLWSSLLATIAALTGLVIGWIRWRPGFGGKATYSKGRTQPYREFWYKWHFWTGLIGGTVALFWAFSGYMDTNPGKIFSEGNPNRQELARYVGGEFTNEILNWQPVLPVLLATAVGGEDVVELGWKRLGSETVLLAHSRDGKRIAQSQNDAPPRFSDESLLAALGRLVGKTSVETQTLLTDYDSYYYPRHHQSLVEKPLPVLLVELGDEAATRYYIDPQDGKILSRLDKSQRVSRWLYSALHHWDFGWLYYRPIWDLWMVIWVGFGIVLGASSLVIGWKRLKITFKAKKPSRYKTTKGVSPVTAEEQVQGQPQTQIQSGFN